MIEWTTTSVFGHCTWTGPSAVSTVLSCWRYEIQDHEDVGIATRQTASDCTQREEENPGHDFRPVCADNNRQQKRETGKLSVNSDNQQGLV